MALTDKLKTIADAIRSKTGSTEELTLDQMATEIEGISGGGDDSALIGLIERTATEITVPNGCTKIGVCAFQSHPTLTTASLPNSVTSIETKAFSTCQKMTNINLPNSVTSIGDYAFQNCSKLELTSLPNSVTYIGQYAFTGCSKLALTSLPNSLSKIDFSAFYQCSALAIKEIPASVTNVGQSIFAKCTGVTELTFKTEPPYNIHIHSQAFYTDITTINVPWAEGEVANAPWGATNATINYNYTGE